MRAIMRLISGTDITSVLHWRQQPSRRSSAQQHDPPPRTAGQALDAGQQLGFAGDASAAIVAHTGEQNTERHLTPSAADVCLVQHAHNAAPVVLDAQEPRLEGTERLGQGLSGRGQRVVAVAAPVPFTAVVNGCGNIAPPPLARWSRRRGPRCSLPSGQHVAGCGKTLERPCLSGVWRRPSGVLRGIFWISAELAGQNHAARQTPGVTTPQQPAAWGSAPRCTPLPPR